MKSEHCSLPDLLSPFPNKQTHCTRLVNPSIPKVYPVWCNHATFANIHRIPLASPRRNEASGVSSSPFFGFGRGKRVVVALKRARIRSCWAAPQFQGTTPYLETALAHNQFLLGRGKLGAMKASFRIHCLPLGVGGFWDASGRTHFLRTRRQHGRVAFLHPATTGQFLRTRARLPAQHFPPERGCGISGGLMNVTPTLVGASALADVASATEPPLLLHPSANGCAHWRKTVLVCFREDGVGSSGGETARH